LPPPPHIPQGVLAVNVYALIVPDPCVALPGFSHAVRSRAGKTTFFKWKAKFGGLDASDAKVAGGREPASEEAVGGGAARQCSPQGSGRKNSDASGRHAAVRHVITHHGLSERRATRLLGVDRSGLRCRPRRPDDARSRAAAGSGGRAALPYSTEISCFAIGIVVFIP